MRNFVLMPYHDSDLREVWGPFGYHKVGSALDVVLNSSKIGLLYDRYLESNMHK